MPKNESRNKEWWEYSRYFHYDRLRNSSKKDETDLSVLNLSNSALKALRQAGINTVEELGGITKTELRNIQHMKLNGFEEIVNKVQTYFYDHYIFDPFPRYESSVDPNRVDGSNPFIDPLENLGLRAVTCTALRTHGVFSIGQLLCLSENKLKRIDDSAISEEYDEIVEKLKKSMKAHGYYHGYTFPDDSLFEQLTSTFRAEYLAAKRKLGKVAQAAV